MAHLLITTHYALLTHLLTHITRATDAFAASTPARPGAGVTYCVSRKRRMVSIGTTLAGGTGAEPAISGDFSVTIPKRRPCVSSAAAPAKPSCGEGCRPPPSSLPIAVVTARPPACSSG